MANCSWPQRVALSLSCFAPHTTADALKGPRFLPPVQVAPKRKRVWAGLGML